MKKKLLKALSLVMAAVALVAITIAGTAAYFTSSSAVTNTFTVGNVGIYLYESPVVDGKIPTDPAPALVNGMKTSSGNNYHLQPGGNYDKDPTVYVNAGSDESYLFVKIRNQIESIEDTNAKHGTIAEQLAKNGWVKFHSVSSGTIYVFAGELDDKTNTNKVIADPSTLSKDNPTPIPNSTSMQSIDLFKEFTVISGPSASDAVKLMAGAKLTVTAFAIQTTGFVDDDDTANGYTALEKAWNAIVATYPYENDSGIKKGSGSD